MHTTVRLLIVDEDGQTVLGVVAVVVLLILVSRVAPAQRCLIVNERVTRSNTATTRQPDGTCPLAAATAPIYTKYIEVHSIYILVSYYRDSSIVLVYVPA